MSYLRQKMKYDIDYVTIWQKLDNGTTDEYGRPQKDWAKIVCRGRWENSVRAVRQWTGDDISSVGNAILPVFLDLRDEILIERGKVEEEEPTINAKKIISMEEITQIRLPAKEWIYYV